MHEIYMIAVVFNASRQRATEPARDQRLRDEQAFYDRHGGDGWPRFRSLAGLGLAVPAAAVALGLVLAVAHMLLR